MNINEYIKLNWESNLFRIKVTPKQAKNEFYSVLDDGTLKIRIKAVAERWKANKELISFLSSELSIPKESIDIVAWAWDQVKIIRIK